MKIINSTRSTKENIEKMPAIGIDIGAGYCRVGVWQDGKVKIILDDQGNRQIQSMYLKRFIGRKLNDEYIQKAMKSWPHDYIDDSGQLKIQIESRGGIKTFALIEMYTSMLKKVKRTAETFLGEEVKDAVISVPACFNYAQRRETINAAKAAGLNVLRVINEPSAAVLAYDLGENFQGEKNLLIFDCGRSKCDVSIISIINTGMFTLFNVKSTAGNFDLGGDNFDNRLIAFLCEELRRKYNKDIKTDICALKKLSIAAEKARHTLSSSTQASIEINALYEGIDYYTKISRATFECICADLFLSTLDYVKQALVNANLDKKSIHDIVLVGGSTHIPKIQSLLQDFFAVEKLNLTLNSYEAVAYGAAVQAALLTDCNKSSVLQGILFPHVVTSSLGIETIDGVMTPIIRRNECCLPCTRTRRFKTSSNNQLGISIKVFEGEQPMTENNEFIGQFELEGITLAPNAVPMIDITFNLDVNGILRVIAADAESNCSDDVLTLMNFYPCQNIEIEREESW